MKHKARKLIDDVEEAKYNPIGEPLLIVIVVLSLKSMEWHEHWVSNTQESGQDSLANAEEDEEDDWDESALDNGLFLKASCLLYFIEYAHIFFDSLII